MNWLYIILISYFILSISNLVDKIFLSSIVTESIVYATWVSVMSVGVVALLVIDVMVSQFIDSRPMPFGLLTFMTLWHTLVAIFVGIIFTLAIYLLYTALQKGEASRVLPVIGGSMPILAFFMTFSYDPLDTAKFLAFLFLVIGTIIISITPRGKTSQPRRWGTIYALAASLSFSLFLVLTQYLSREEGFMNSLVWPQLGTAVALVFLAFSKSIRASIANSLKPLSFRMKVIWLASQGLGAIGFVGQRYVISFPHVSVALVSALQSFQYVFILLFAALITFFKPKLLQEHISAPVILQKIAALIFIGIGLYFVAI